MGRSPCCDKVGLKKGPWTPEEDHKLLAYIEEHGHGSWRALPSKAGLQRCGKSCRLRWTNYLRPDIKRGKFSLQEEQTIIQLHALLGNRWSAIATHLPKRTDNEIKNYWNTHLKKRLAKMGIDPATHKPKNKTLSSSQGQSKQAANLSHMAQWESARLEAEARLVRQSKLRCSSSTNNNNNPQTPQPPANKPVASPRLDVLKAFNGVWMKPNEGGASTAGGGAANLESPTSTLSYSENNNHNNNNSNNGGAESSMNGFMELGGNSSAQFHGYGDGLSCNMTMPLFDTTSTNDDHHHHDGIFMEKFTDLLLRGGSAADRSAFSEVETDHGGSSGGTAAAESDGDDEDKSYWNSVLNLVNYSPSDNPPVF